MLMCRDAYYAHYPRTHTQSLTHSHIHNHTYTLTYTRANTHTHTHAHMHRNSHTHGARWAKMWLKERKKEWKNLSELHRIFLTFSPIFPFRSLSLSHILSIFLSFLSHLSPLFRHQQAFLLDLCRIKQSPNNNTFSLSTSSINPLALRCNNPATVHWNDLLQGPVFELRTAS